jgi:hypothetical protein
VGTPTRPLGEPISDGLGHVGGDGVPDDVDVEIAGNVGFDDVQEGAGTHRTMARSGGERQRPAMSRTFSTNKGSVDNLKVSARWG